MEVGVCVYAAATNWICAKEQRRNEVRVKEKQKEGKNCKHTSFTLLFAPQIKMQVFLFEAWCKI